MEGGVVQSRAPMGRRRHRLLACAAVVATLGLLPASMGNNLRLRVPGPDQKFAQDVSKVRLWKLDRRGPCRLRAWPFRCSTRSLHREKGIRALDEPIRMHI